LTAGVDSGGESHEGSALAMIWFVLVALLPPLLLLPLLMLRTRVKVSVSPARGCGAPPPDLCSNATAANSIAALVPESA
jgi:hypothetical protein